MYPKPLAQQNMAGMFKKASSGRGNTNRGVPDRHNLLIVADTCAVVTVCIGTPRFAIFISPSRARQNHGTPGREVSLLHWVVLSDTSLSRNASTLPMAVRLRHVLRSGFFATDYHINKNHGTLNTFEDGKGGPWSISTLGDTVRSNTHQNDNTGEKHIDSWYEGTAAGSFF